MRTVYIAVFYSLFLPVTICGKPSRYIPLYSNSRQLSIQDVRHSDMGTQVSFCCQGTPFSPIAIASSIYVSDENNVRHNANSADGIKLDSTCYLPDDGNLHFTITFDSLPKGTRFFDIIESEKSSSYLHIYGIHRKRERVAFVSAPDEVRHEEFDPAFFKPGNVVIRGQIHGYSRDSMHHVLSFPQHTESMSYSERLTRGLGRYAKVEKDGSFQKVHMIDRACITRFGWADGLDFYADMYIRPSDTLNVQIWNPGRWNQRVVCHNTKGREEYNRLMELWYFKPELKDYIDLNTISEEKLKAGIEDMRIRVGILLDYFCHKYRLTAWEHHLLRTNYSLTLNASFRRYRAQLEESSPQGQEHFEASAIPNDYFLSDINWNDSTLILLNAAYNDDYDYFAGLMAKAGLKDDLCEKRLHPSGWNARTYVPTDIRAKEFIDSLCAETSTPFIHLVFMDPWKDWDALNREVNKKCLDVLNSLGYYLQDNKDVRLWIVLNAGKDRAGLDRFKRQIDYDLGCIELAEDDFIHLLAAFDRGPLARDLTVQKDGQVFALGGLYTYNDDDFLSRLYRLLNNKH